MTRMQQFDAEVKEVTKRYNRENGADARLLTAEFCGNPNECYILQQFVAVSIYAGDGQIAKWISDNGFVVCKKIDATALLIVGNKSESGSWIIGQYKNYWLKPKV